jgi:hypothetical protein
VLILNAGILPNCPPKTIDIAGAGRSTVYCRMDCLPFEICKTDFGDLSPSLKTRSSIPVHRIGSLQQNRAHHGGEIYVTGVENVETLRQKIADGRSGEMHNNKKSSIHLGLDDLRVL